MSETPEQCLQQARHHAAAGQPGPCMEAISRAVALAPGDAAVQEIAATILVALGRTDEAERAYRHALSLDPDRAGALFGLAALLVAGSTPQAGLDLVDRGCSLYPADPRGPRLLGRMYLEQGLLAGAIQSLERALALAPDDQDARADLGLALQTAGHSDRARACYLQVIETCADHDAALRGLARLAELAGEPGALIPKLEPLVNNGRASSELVAVYARLLGQVGRRDAALDLLRQRLEEAPADGERMPLLFQLGQLHDLADRPGEAMACMLEANRLKHAVFDAAHYETLVDRLIDCFSATAMGRLPRSKSEDPRPVFVVGMPRSGTSLTEQILASHPQVAAAGERSELGLLALATASDGRVYPEAVNQLAASQIAAMGRHYVDAVCPSGPGAVRVTDKMWQNFEYLGLAELMLPGARVIHCVRDPLDCGLSCFFQHFFGSGVAFSYDLADIGAFMVQYRRIMAHWQQVLSLPIFELRYETLVAEPEATIRALLAFLDLPWDPVCLEFHRHRREVRTASFDQVRQPLYRSSVGRHQPYLRWLEPLIGALATER